MLKRRYFSDRFQIVFGVGSTASLNLQQGNENFLKKFNPFLEVLRL
jgi:hypothetical protein